MATETTNTRYKQSGSKAMRRALLLVNCIILAIGNSGGPLMMRFYFLKGGKSIWLESWLETAGWPFILLPILVSYYYRRKKEGPGTRLFFISPALFAACAVIGILTGLDDYMYSYGVSLLPLSTSELIIATQLAFTAGFAYLLVKQRFTAYSINSIFLLSVGAVVLAFHTSSDLPAHETKKQYYVGFIMVLGAAALYGFVLPLIELTYMKAKEVMTYSLVMEMQMIMSLFATIFCTVGMLCAHDFQTLPGEAKVYQYGEAMYYVMLVLTSIIWQFFFMGAIGVIFCSSSLLSGIIIATLLPVTETLAVWFYHEKFQIEKGLSLALNLWGFLSYFYGELQASKKKKQTAAEEEEVEELPRGQRTMIT